MIRYPSDKGSLHTCCMLSCSCLRNVRASNVSACVGGCTFMSVCTRPSVFLFAQLCACVRACVSVCVSVRVFVCLSVCRCVCFVCARVCLCGRALAHTWGHRSQDGHCFTHHVGGLVVGVCCQHTLAQLMCMT